jgi:hypothetical protein
MIHRPTRLTAYALVAISLALTAGHAVVAQSDSEFTAEPSWEQIKTGAVAEQIDDYLASADIDSERKAAVLSLWQSAEQDADGDVLDRLAACLAKADDRVSVLVDYCTGVSKPGPLPEFDWLADSDTPVLVRHNMRLYLARWLVQQGYYDQAIAWTEGLDTDDVVQPESLLFYRAVAHHRLVEPDEADAALSQLLEREDDLPNRYQKLAGLMRQDLSGLEDESLDHIARRMEDVRRRLAQGSSGQHVQKVENGVIESLDKMIKKLEDQMQQSQSSSSAGGQPNGAPMQDSQIAELKGPGKIEPRDIGRRAGWGNLPEKDREKAMQDIGREFPSHYREVIEEYFRRLAAEESEPAERP